MSAFILSLLILLVALSFQVMCAADKEGFLTYVVYGPAAPDLRLQGPDPWFARPAWRRPYWGWRRRFWNGPCPGPWCPYA